MASLDVAGLCVEPPEKPSFSSQLLLPDGVPDIDSGDRDEPQLCAQYAKDIFDYLVSLEVGSLTAWLASVLCRLAGLVPSLAPGF